ncbi:SusC/RagA family TonB-linked outer membrane protein [Labilibaculum sp. K2S]|uniref:SusC/RagA family TonB-linked outer membrane protein n=1 Tax=Labilibaculum sp. K2S TaxID=3056386 RepID=UPI0025A45506|nr:SusC/RagA family TonB-linked outer membrane protein [Labilibaculum sp. K2S]MDM8159869.1 SusC/RagA family TonB-linked outer membrane protein [Labilibaculum sp. K2S]
MRIQYRYIILSLFVFLTMKGWSQTGDTTGKIIDRNGNPVSGAVVSIESNPENKVYTNTNGEFNIFVQDSAALVVQTSNNGFKKVSVKNGESITIQMDFFSEAVELGYGIHQTIGESTGAVSLTTHEQVNQRSAFSVSNALYGNALGLTAMQNSGAVWDTGATLSIRGLQTLSNNDILVVVDGIERDIQYVVPEEVESVSVLRDAAAVALYGYKGINGVLSITTLRGKYQTSEINVSYDHAFNWQSRLPKFADSYTYASAVNEALSNDGKSARYSENELGAFKSGEYPNLYPNIDWMDEVFRENGCSNMYNVNFRGGGKKVRYFTMLNLQGNQGFIDNSDVNDGYSTQMKYSKGNIRTNLDIDVSSTTTVQVNLMGVLNEFSRPGLGSDNLISKLYTTPSAAFPIKTSDGIWGGSETWGSNMNPVALTQARGYSKGHTRSLYADVRLTQDLNSITEGLSASLRAGYDNVAAYWEGHTKNYAYASENVVSWVDGKPSDVSIYSAGADSGIEFGSKLDWQDRHSNLFANVDYQKESGKNKIFSSLMYSYEHHVKNSQNHTYYRQNVAGYIHYVYNNRYVADLTLATSGSNKLAPGEKWGFSPTVSAAWIISNENFMKNVKPVDFLKLRASWGIINTDYIPTEDYWEQSFGNGGSYPLGGSYSDYGGVWEGRLASTNTSREKAIKYNLGLDVGILNGMVITADTYFEKRKDIWVSAGGANSAVLGISSPYTNAGIVDSWGLETGVNYNKQLGDFKISLGGKFTLAKNKVKEMLEEPKAYEYLRQTGKSVDQIFGLQAIGFFVDQADIANSPAQQFNEVKPGDIKFKDQNNDGVINDYDNVAMGYNTNVPEIYYSFDLGFEWKGLGLSATFQGVERYTAILNTQSVYRPLVDNSTISEHYYNNRWTPENPSAKYPRLTTESNENNFQTNSVWLADASFLKLRNCEIYYKLAETYLSKLRLKSAKFYVRGIDLLCIDNINLSDPESVGVAYPMTRSINVGLAIGF